MGTFLVVLSAVCWILGLTQTSFLIQHELPELYARGPGLLIIGWLGLRYGIVAWLANPVYFYALTCALNKQTRRGLIAAVIALLLGLSFLFLRQVPISFKPQWVDITAYGWGLRWWLLSLALLCVAFLYQAFCEWRTAPTVQILDEE
ncbi:hypothetical protein [Parvibium lacunae]|uniref:Uncharacterized protein n=1 Tax=Parvibium lacunae TaxID=1888893 RepID=A0A368KYU2_9BURK|nr:hypothetical protein [Parvibium lacunae]RCS56577.1 hypothetical protein DU000_11470 [Parvibium lacunae]